MCEATVVFVTQIVVMQCLVVWLCATGGIFSVKNFKKNLKYWDL